MRPRVGPKAIGGVMSLLVAVTACAPPWTPPTATACGTGSGGEAPAATWTMSGYDAANTRRTVDSTITAANVATLECEWGVQSQSNVAAAPAVVGGSVYYTDFGLDASLFCGQAGYADCGGRLRAVDDATGAELWSHRISEYTGFVQQQTNAPIDVSRSTPVVVGDTLLLANRPPRGELLTGGESVGLIAVDRFTGNLAWYTPIESQPAAQITGSPMVAHMGGHDIAFVGVSSKEEDLPAPYPCCSFRGSIAAIDVTAGGTLLWKAYTTPVGYTGAAVWSSTPAVDVATDTVFFTTGNNYTVPSGVCNNPGEVDCAPADPADRYDSVVALDATTGASKWARRVWPPDAQGGGDVDFGSGPQLFTGADGQELVGAGQKSGVYWALDRGTGEVIWSTKVGAGNGHGGIMWGSAVDDASHRVFVADSIDATWNALDTRTGEIVWQTADPQGPNGATPAPPEAGAVADIGFVTSVNDIVFAGSNAIAGDDMFALSATDGAILWRHASGGAVVAGPAVVDGFVYWGYGYYDKGGCPLNPDGSLVAGCPNGFGLIKFSLPTS